MSSKGKGRSKFSCEFCEEKLTFVAVDPDDAMKMVFSCPNCEMLVRKDKPDNWIDNTQHHGNVSAMKEGRSIKQDPLVDDKMIDDAIEGLLNTDITKLDNEQIGLLTKQITISGFLKNVKSRRPTVRQRALEALASITIPKAPSTLNIGQVLPEGMTSDDLLTRSAELQATIIALREKKQKEQES